MKEPSDEHLVEGHGATQRWVDDQTESQRDAWHELDHGLSQDFLDHDHKEDEQVEPATMRQVAPRPDVLFELVEQLTYRPGWTFHLSDIDRGQGSEGLTLDIITLGYNSYHPDQGENYRVHHFMPVPPAAFDKRSWRRWLFEQLLLVERHEACEFFVVGGVRPYAPHHGPGNDPYIVFEHGDDEDVRTSFRGQVKPAAEGLRA